MSQMNEIVIPKTKDALKDRLLSDLIEVSDGRKSASTGNAVARLAREAIRLNELAYLRSQADFDL